MAKWTASLAVQESARSCFRREEICHCDTDGYPVFHSVTNIQSCGGIDLRMRMIGFVPSKGLAEGYTGNEGI
jgi:hypothetical protein